MSTDTYRDVSLPDPHSAPELFAGVLPRRMVAFGIDLIALTLMSVAIFVVGLVIGVLTLGLGWLALPIVIPLAILGYYAGTLGSPMRATLGMRMMDLVLTPTRGRPLNGWSILIHPIVFWITCWIAWPVSLAFALFTPRQQMVHDYVSGTLMLRRSPMVRHWRSTSGYASRG